MRAEGAGFEPARLLAHPLSSWIRSVRRQSRSFFNGFDPQHTVQNVEIDNMRINGKRATSAAEAFLAIGANVSAVRFCTAR